MATVQIQIWIYTVCKGRTYPGSAGQALRVKNNLSSEKIILVHVSEHLEKFRSEKV